MFFRSIRIFSIFISVSLVLMSACSAAGTQHTTDKTSAGVGDVTTITGTLFDQPLDPNGKLLLSAWLDPDGSDADQYIWENFTLQSNETITDINWFGVYDPLRFGAGGPVIDFSVSIYPSIAVGTEPDIANPPLVRYQTGGNAGETALGTVGGTTLYAYAFHLPGSFAASAGVKYWVQIEAAQHGRLPDWCLAPGMGGDGRHFQRTSGAGGDILYRSAPGDAAFSLLGLVPVTLTPTDTPTETATEIPTDTATDPATGTEVLPDTPTDTLTPSLMPSQTETPSETATLVPTETSTMLPSETPTATETQFVDIPTETPTDAPVPTPLSNTPGKVTGGGTIDVDQQGGKATFGFVVDYKPGDPAPNGNLTYQDHTTNMRLKATSFDMLVIEGNHAWFSGTGTTDDGQTISFTVAVDVSNNMFYLSIPALNGYTAVNVMSGGNITIH